MTADHPKGATAQGDAPRRSWWFVDELHPFEFAIHLPWFNRRRPYVALHVAQWGYEVHQGRTRRVLHVGLMWGRLFTDRKTYRAKWWDVCGRWSA
jgi:hypothetical protein